MTTTTAVGLGDTWANHLLREGARLDRKVPMSTTIITTQPLATDGTTLALYRREGLYYVALTGPSCPWLQQLDEAVYATYTDAQERLAAEVRARTTEKEMTMVEHRECESCLETGQHVPATTHSTHPDFAGYHLCEECAAEYDARKEMTMRGRCLYCLVEGDARERIPAPSDDEAWARLAQQHAPDCEWIQTRAHFDGWWHSDCYERQQAVQQEKGEQ